VQNNGLLSMPPNSQPAKPNARQQAIRCHQQPTFPKKIVPNQKNHFPVKEQAKPIIHPNISHLPQLNLSIKRRKFATKRIFERFSKQ
jgi:hypothetical protein